MALGGAAGDRIGTGLDPRAQLGEELLQRPLVLPRRHGGVGPGLVAHRRLESVGVVAGRQLLEDAADGALGDGLGRFIERRRFGLVIAALSRGGRVDHRRAAGRSRPARAMPAIVLRSVSPSATSPATAASVKVCTSSRSSGSAVAVPPLRPSAR